VEISLQLHRSFLDMSFYIFGYLLEP
jgi:hypothetical protein